MTPSLRLVNELTPAHPGIDAPQIAVIIPACDEEACIGPVLEELLATIDRAKFVVAVGVNDSSDRTAEVARSYGVVTGQTAARGYGHGCTAAIEAVIRQLPSVRAYIFFAADGASDPRDIAALAAAHEQGSDMVLGTRTTQRSNWRAMTLPHVVANVMLGFWCGALGGRWFADLAPLRLIDRSLFEAIAPQEMTFGWTIEAQVGAAMLGARIRSVPARERCRIAGEQKVSGVTWRRTLMIGCRIFAAGWRAHCRFSRELVRRLKRREFVASSQSSA
jgi:hypothetical protein